MTRKPFILCVMLIPIAATRAEADAAPTKAEAQAAIRNAVEFFHGACSKNGGYVWRYSRDLRLSEGEAETDETMIWVQPPGTPAVGMAFLDAYGATGDRFYLAAAEEAADALVRGQLQSGGWYYHIQLHAEKRKTYGYRDNKAFRPSSTKKNRTNVTTLDDDTTSAATRCLIRMDKQLSFRQPRIHDAATFALEALLAAQYPNGGWHQNWDTYPDPQSEKDYPIIRASYPESWSRRWLNDWPGRYFINDNVMGNMIATMLEAWEVYGEEEYLHSATRAGDFLVLAQMPEPQPAWAQQYDAEMHPVWDRKFEPPSISGWESQDVMEALMLLYDKTGEAKYLEPIPPALAYLRKSRLPGGRLARFYELGTNRPLYFKRTGKKYDLTYFSDDLPTHYGFIVESRLDEIEARYTQLINHGPAARERAPDRAELAQQVGAIIDGMDDRGAWIDKRSMKGFRKASPEGVIQSETFINNVKKLCQYVESFE